MELTQTILTPTKMTRSEQTISLEIVINSHLSDAEIEASFNKKLALTRTKFVNLLLAKNSITERVTDAYLNSVWEVAESGLTNGEKYIKSYTDFMLSKMLDKVSGGW